MSDPKLPPTNDDQLHDDDTLPPEHPAGSDAPVSAGAALSAEGTGTGAVGAPSGTSGREPDGANVPGDDS